MHPRHGDIFSSIYLEKAVKGYAKASPQKKSKWFEPRRGLIRRLLNKPFFTVAPPSAQQIFLWLLEARLLKAMADYC
jgi:hypothetical protein